MKIRRAAAVAFMAAVLIIQQIFPAQAAEVQELYALSAVLMDGETGRVLYGKEAYKARPNASTTKVMTCIMALEMGKGDDYVQVSKNAASQPQTRLGMKVGQQFYLEDLLYSLMLKSHNDTAVAIAEHIGGSVEKFAILMNNKAKEIGCTDTHFVTPNGLDGEDEGGIHHTTARDLGLIMTYAVKNTTFVHITQTRNYTFSDISGKKYYSVHNTNAFLDMETGVISGKTGFTGNAGYCYVGALTKGEKGFTIALLACGWPNNRTWKWHDARLLLEYGLEAFDQRSLQQPDLPKTLLVENGQLAEVSLNCPKKEIRMLLSRGDQTDVRVSLPGQLTAPVEAGEQVGTVSYLVNGALYEQLPVTVAFGVPKITYCYCLKRLLALVLL